MFATVIFTLVIGAETSAEQARLLRTFRQEFVAITPSQGRFQKSFLMGRARGGRENETPAHEVTFDYEFSIAKYEVPQNLWEVVMGANPSRWKGPRNSVEMLSFDEALEFCQRATKLMRTLRLIREKEQIRLPSEAEWEYGAHAGTTNVYSFGDQVEQLGDYGWFDGNAAGNDPTVGAKKPNAWGLYDIHGYLWEWCLDTAHEDYRGAPADGSAWIQDGDEKQRILRGGSWEDRAEQLTCSFRRAVVKELRDDSIGLRCVLALEPGASAQ